MGSDYVFPRTANKEIKAYAEANGIAVRGEEYAPLGHTDFVTIVNKARAAGAGAVFNTLNGDSNVAFFKEYRNAGLTAPAMPVLSVSIAEEEVGGPSGVPDFMRLYGSGRLPVWWEPFRSPVVTLRRDRGCPFTGQVVFRHGAT